MFKVLLVDDEWIIREGISTMIDWARYDIELIGAAKDALEAYDIICNHSPHIVITDIKMPVMDGLELIEKVRERFPEIIFVVLSGYGEFDFASRAMRHGVKHYLLKPCSENRIIEVLEEVKGELALRKKRDELISKSKENMEKLMPLVREQFLRDLVMNKTYTREEYKYYNKMLDIDDKPVRLMLFQPEEHGYEELFALRSIIEEVLGNKILYLNTLIKDQVLTLVDAVDDDTLLGMITDIKEYYHYYKKMEVTISYSDYGNLEDLPIMYNEVQQCIKYSFYLGEGSIITKKDIHGAEDERGNNVLVFDYEKISTAVKNGNIIETKSEIDRFFDELNRMKYEISISRTYCVQLLMSVIRDCSFEDIDKNIKKIVEIQRMNTLDEIYDFVLELGSQLAKAKNENIVSKHSKIVRRIMNIIDENLENEDLSLKWIAQEKLYMNDRYLSKLFKKETGENFSQYLMRVRMEKAQQLIQMGDADKVYEIAEKVGFGNNPQYFSHVFKKHTGSSPSEFKRNNFV